jgi:hypothetical protein
VAEDPEPEVDLVAMRLEDRLFFADELSGVFRGKMMADLRSIGWEPLGSPHFADDELPVLLTVPPLRPAGIAPPLVGGYDREFLLREGVHPRVPLTAGSDLANQRVPLDARTDSYDRAEQAVAEQRLPDPREVRVEDFLAALDYHFPLPRPGQRKPESPWTELPRQPI